jgi:hypothetical protein
MSETTQVHELSMANMASATRLMRLNNPGGVRIFAGNLHCKFCRGCMYGS